VIDVAAIHMKVKPAGEKNDCHVHVTMNNQALPHFLLTPQ